MEPLATLPMIRKDIDAAHKATDMDPLTRLQDVRKRMRTGRHKYAVPGWDAGMSSSSAESILQQPLLPINASGQEEAAELVNLLHIRDVCTNSTCSTQTATSSTKTPAAIRPPLSTFSPPPTPGRNHDHGSVSPFTDFPNFLPRGSSTMQAVKYGYLPTRATDKTQPCTNVPSSTLTENDAPLPPADIIARLKPRFTLSTLQDLIPSQQRFSTSCSNGSDYGNSSSDCVVPELPFQSDCQSSTANKNNIIKGSPKMPMVRLPHRIREISERSAAARLA